jgi:hypothetical protein
MGRSIGDFALCVNGEDGPLCGGYPLRPRTDELAFSQSPPYSGIRAGGPCVKSSGPARKTAGRHRELGGRVIKMVFLALSCGFGRWFGFYPPYFRRVNFP